MPYVPHGDGVSVVENMLKDQSLSPKDRELVLLTLYKDMLDGLKHAHENNVAHKDVKLDNLMISGQGKGQLIDWGVAKKQGANVGATGKDDNMYKHPSHVLQDKLLGKKGENGWKPSYVATPAGDVFSAGGVVDLLLSEKPALGANERWREDPGKGNLGLQNLAGKSIH